MQQTQVKPVSPAGSLWLTVILPLLVSGINGKEEKAVCGELESKLRFNMADSSLCDQACLVLRHLTQAVIDNSSEYPHHMNLLP